MPAAASLPRPAIALAAVPGRRLATLELAREIERRDFSGIYCASFGDGLALCEALAFATERIPFGTAIANLYARPVTEYAGMTSFIHEVSGGRFRFGIGVSHAVMNQRLGAVTGKPLTDTRAFVEGLRAVPRTGDQPPIVVAGLRKRMVALAGEIGDGLVFANAACSHMQESLSALPPGRAAEPGYFVGNMIPTCIHEDIEKAARINQKTLSFYLNLPNYRNYWREAGYADEIQAVEDALERGDRNDLPQHMGERWLSDCTLYGPPERVLEGLAAWYAAGVTTPILVPSSAEGNQMKAFEELFALFDQ